MSTSPPPRPHRRVRSVPIHLNFRITPLTTSTASTYFPPTSGTATPSPLDSPNDLSQPRKRCSRRGSRSSGTHTPSTHLTSGAFEDHPTLEIKRSSSTFFQSSLPSYKHDWTYRHGARVTAESLEEQGRSWLISRASSTDLAGQGHWEESDSDDDDEGFYRHSRDLEILDIGETMIEETQENSEEQKEIDWARWVKTFMDFGEESESEEIEWKTPRRRTVAFADPPQKDIDERVVQRARERDEEHGMDGWMDGAAYLGFLGIRAIGGLF